MMVENTIYEISDYNQDRGTVRLRLLFDPNGILIDKSNTYNKVLKEIRGTTLDKHYFILPQEEEYNIR